MEQIIDNTMQEPAIESMSDNELNAFEAKAKGAEVPTPIEEQPEKPEEPQAPPIEKVLADQKAFIGRQSTEIGELRKQLAQLQAMMLQAKQPPVEEQPEADPAAENEEFFKAPVEKIKAILEQREREKAEKEQADIETRKANRTRVLEVVPDFDDIAQDVFSVLLADGFPEEQVIEFAKNPWKERPEALIALSKRARAEKRLRELEAGKAPVQEDKSKPRITVPKNPITASTGNSRAERTSYLNGLTDADISKMSDEELNAILKKAGG